MVFVFNIIDGKKFRTYRPIRYSLYFLLILLVALVNEPKRKYRDPIGPNSFAQLLGIDSLLVWSLIFLVGIFALLFYYYSIQSRTLGKIEINRHYIKITNGSEIETFNIESILDLTIERGSTWHYSYQQDNFLIKIDNWFKFTAEGEEKEIEFALSNQQDNKNFENMMIYIKQNRIKHKYISI
jgi:hypothetical protein